MHHGRLCDVCYVMYSLKCSLTLAAFENIVMSKSRSGAMALLRDYGNMDYGGSSMMERGAEHSILFCQVLSV